MRKKMGEKMPEKTYPVKLTKFELALLFRAAEAVVNNLTPEPALNANEQFYLEDKDSWNFLLNKQSYEILRSAKRKVMEVSQDVAAGRAA